MDTGREVGGGWWCEDHGIEDLLLFSTTNANKPPSNLFHFHEGVKRKNGIFLDLCLPVHVGIYLRTDTY